MLLEDSLSSCFFLRHVLPKTKIELLNLDIHQFFYSEQLMHLKLHSKGSLCMAFKENPTTCFFMHVHPRSKIRLLNLDMHHNFVQIYVHIRMQI